MSEQTAFDFHRLARRKDPQTSVDAAGSVSSFKARHISLIYEALCFYGPMTFEEIADKTRLDRIAVGRRLKEMVERELIHETDDTRRTSTGRRARVMKIGEKRG